MRLLALTALTALAGCVIPVAIPIGAATFGTPGVTQSQPVEENQAFATNFAALRTGAGLDRLVPDAGLTRAAQAHAQDMETNSYFSHTGLDGSRPAARARAQGVCYSLLAENIANGVTTEAEVVEIWRASPPHRANMLARTANSYGLGRAGDTWVLMVARRC